LKNAFESIVSGIGAVIFLHFDLTGYKITNIIIKDAIGQTNLSGGNNGKH